MVALGNDAPLYRPLFFAPSSHPSFIVFLLLWCPWVMSHDTLWSLYITLWQTSTRRFVGPRLSVRDIEARLDFQSWKRVERKLESRNAHGTTDKMWFFHQKTGVGLKKSQEEMRERTTSQSEWIIHAFRLWIPSRMTGLFGVRNATNGPEVNGGERNWALTHLLMPRRHRRCNEKTASDSTDVNASRPLVGVDEPSGCMWPQRSAINAWRLSEVSRFRSRLIKSRWEIIASNSSWSCRFGP